MPKGKNSKPRDIKPYNWENEEGDWVFDTYYNLEKHKPIIKKHFEKGLTLASLSGALGVSKSTIYNWIKERSDFKAVVQRYEGLAELKTDEEHYRAAVGETENANAAMLNRRAEVILGFNGKEAKIINKISVNKLIQETVGSIDDDT